MAGAHADDYIVWRGKYCLSGRDKYQPDEYLGNLEQLYQIYRSGGSACRRRDQSD